MLALWLIEFLLVALIALATCWMARKLIQRARAQTEAQRLSQELMRFDEARSLILQYAQREMRRGLSREQALLKVFSDEYWLSLAQAEPGQSGVATDQSVLPRAAKRER